MISAGVNTKAPQGGARIARKADLGGATAVAIAILLAAYPANADDESLASIPAGPSQSWALHAQFTSLVQYHPAFHATYSGPNSLDHGSRGDDASDVTIYLGAQPWRGGEIWADPEVDQGFGLSNTEGVAGFPNGESTRVGRSTPYLRLQRWFFRQTIDLGGQEQKVDADLNQLAGEETANHVVITVGKFAVDDVFDTNRYANDGRVDFLNWALIDTGTFDYASDAWGYTYGLAGEWYQGAWTSRVGLFDLSTQPNSEGLDPSFRQFQYDAEQEHRHQLFGQPGAVRITEFLTRGRMGALDAAIAQAARTGGPIDIAAVRRYASRGGVGLSVEQQLTPDLGVFARAGLAEGDKETYEFTDIDRTLAAGISLGGRYWSRGEDILGVAGVIDAISEQRKRFLEDGGLGLLVGDGKLLHSGPEDILETYYSARLVKPLQLTVDYQFVANPAYNRDRGPVSVLAVRLHAQF